jgi:stress response protein YsnF
MNNMVVGLVDMRSEAEEVAHDLVSEGFDRKDIHVVANDHEFDPGETPIEPGREKESGFHHLMVRLGFLDERREKHAVPQEDADYYSEGVRRGGYLVAIDTGTEGEIVRATEILKDHGAVDIRERAEQWQRTGWTGPVLDTEAVTTGTTVRTLAEPTHEEARIPVVEEELKVGKRTVTRGGVSVYSHVTTTPVSETVSLREEHLSVERHPVDRPVTDADLAAFKESTLELIETAEEAVVSKEARVVEEVIVSKDVTEHDETIRDTVRRTDVKVEERA